MTIAQSLYTYLTADSSIGAVVGDRIYPQIIPQAELGRPALTYFQESGEYIEHLAGRSDLRMAEFEINCWSPTYLAARNLAQVVDTALTGLRGAFGGDTAESIRKTNDFDGGYENDTGLYRVVLRFSIAYY